MFNQSSCARKKGLLLKLYWTFVTEEKRGRFSTSPVRWVLQSSWMSHKHSSVLPFFVQQYSPIVLHSSIPQGSHRYLGQIFWHKLILPKFRCSVPKFSTQSVEGVGVFCETEASPEIIQVLGGPNLLPDCSSQFCWLLTFLSSSYSWKPSAEEFQLNN